MIPFGRKEVIEMYTRVIALLLTALLGDKERLPFGTS